MKSNIDFLQTKQNVYHISYWRWSFYIHVYSSIFALIGGFTQFSNSLLSRYPRIHRAVGYAYVLIVVIISGPASFVMAMYANGGLPARVSFMLLAGLWIACTFLAWYFAVRRKFVQHRAFMIRSYALTLSAITLRFYTMLFANLEIDARPFEIYITTAWLSWVPNLIVAEIIISSIKIPKIIAKPH